jgi:S-(hydroxymethyl)glutathione dehydrogenase/alcohol dehydrogenase
VPRAAVVYEHGGPVDVVDVALAPLGAHDVRVKVAASGVCHSDVAAQTGALDFPTPIILGHEGAGTVVEVGPEVTEVAPGDRVALSAIISCGRCRPCVEGTPNLCEWGLPIIFSCRQPDGGLRATDPEGRELHQFASLGTLAEEVIVPDVATVRIPDDVSFEAAALVGCGVLTGVGAVLNRSRLRPGDTVAVIGCGGVGLNVVQAAAMVGAGAIIAIDREPAKLQLARTLGASDVVDASDVDVLQTIRQVTNGRGVDVAFECVGSGALVRLAWDAVSISGTVVAIGVAPGDDVVTLPAQELAVSEKTLMSCLYGSSRPRLDMARYLQLYRQGKLRLDELVTRRYRLGDVDDAIADLHASRNARGVVIMP